MWYRLCLQWKVRRSFRRLDLIGEVGGDHHECDNPKKECRTRTAARHLILKLTQAEWFDERQTVPCPEMASLYETDLPRTTVIVLRMLACPFCAISPERILQKSEVAIAFFDGFRVTEGHALVVPREHVESLYQFSAKDQAALWALVSEVRTSLMRQYTPDGFNIAVNDGEAAGQTIGHAHIHVIPRRVGDSPDPRGGIRRLFPEKARYWEL